MKTLQTFKRLSTWPFQKDSFVELSGTKAGRESNLHGVFSERSHPVRGEGSFISRGVLSSLHVSFRGRRGSKPSSRVTSAKVAAFGLRRPGQIPLYLAQNPLGRLGELPWITLSLMIRRATEREGLEPPEFISWTWPFDLVPRLTQPDKQIECVCVL